MSASFTQPEVILVENVPGFPGHEDYPLCLQVLEAAGYKVLWETCSDLADILPVRRERFLMLCVHREAQGKAPIPPIAWYMSSKPSLHHAKALYKLPDALKTPLLLDPGTWSMYVDPQFYPASFGKGSPDTLFRLRYRISAQQAPTFVASYGHQHELPVGMLRSTGIHGSLLATEGGYRFFSPVEISSAHGTGGPLLLPHDNRQAWLYAGNAIAPPHAAMGLIQACRFLMPNGLPDSPDALLHRVVVTRMHHSNTCLIPLPTGWLMVKRTEVQQVLRKMLDLTQA